MRTRRGGTAAPAASELTRGAERGSSRAAGQPPFPNADGAARAQDRAAALSFSVGPAAARVELAGRGLSRRSSRGPGRARAWGALPLPRAEEVGGWRIYLRRPRLRVQGAGLRRRARAAPALRRRGAAAPAGGQATAGLRRPRRRARGGRGRPEELRRRVSAGASGASGCGAAAPPMRPGRSSLAPPRLPFPYARLLLPCACDRAEQLAEALPAMEGVASTCPDLIFPRLDLAVAGLPASSGGLWPDFLPR
ncbi:unnamed protein product [Urochloa humidicola]